MTILFIDTETHPIGPGVQAPRQVCAQIAIDNGPVEVLARPDAIERLRLLIPRVDLIVGFNVAFEALSSSATAPDLLEPWLEAYAADRVTDGMTREGLDRIKHGLPIKRLALLDCLKYRGLSHRFESGKVETRHTFDQLEGLPVSAYPPTHLNYAEEDTFKTRELYYAQPPYHPEEFDQARASLVLSATTARGMRIDHEWLERWRREMEIDFVGARSRLQARGIVRPNGTKDQKLAAAEMERLCIAKGIEVKTTAKGKVSLTKDRCAEVGLDDYAKLVNVTTLRSRAARLAKARVAPIQPRYRVLVETTRTSARVGNENMQHGDQVQNLPREGLARGCYVPRHGYLLYACDWSSAELHGFAQIHVDLGLGDTLARRLNAGIDEHVSLACTLRGWDYDQAFAARKKDPLVSHMRQCCKAYNYGFSGGLGPAKMVGYAKASYGADITIDEARDAKRGWMDHTPETRAYFKIAEQCEALGYVDVARTGLRRGGVRYTQACNTPFQSLIATMAKDAGWHLFDATMRGGLFGSHIWAFMHDEWILEVWAPKAEEHAKIVEKIMLDASRRWCPDSPPGVEGKLMDRWIK